MDIDPSKKHSTKNNILVLGLAGTLALSGCGRPDTELGTATASEAPYNTAPANIPSTAQTPANVCTDLQSYDVVTDADGTNRYAITIPQVCSTEPVGLFNEQGAEVGHMPNHTEFDIICSAANAQVNPTFKIHLDNPERYGRVHLSPTLVTQESTNTTVPNC